MSMGWSRTQAVQHYGSASESLIYAQAMTWYYLCEPQFLICAMDTEPG